MTTAFYFGAIMGLMGFMHCIGMCGPLYLLVHQPQNTRWSSLGDHLVYHFGKILSYVTLGVLSGFFAESLSIFMSQQRISILLGVSFIIYFFVQYFRLGSIDILGYWSIQVSSYLGPLSRSAGVFGILVRGMSNGLLPCGLVYTAAVASVQGGGMIYSIVLMIGFGIGTIPSLLGLAYIFSRLSSSIKILLQMIYRYLTLLIGILLLLRGLGLGIPLLSPTYNVDKQEVIGCCHK